jgi:hypothetical protein
MMIVLKVYEWRNERQIGSSIQQVSKKIFLNKLCVSVYDAQCIWKVRFETERGTQGGNNNYGGVSGDALRLDGLTTYRVKLFFVTLSSFSFRSKQAQVSLSS